MTVIKQYNVGTSVWETIVVGAQGPQGFQGATGPQGEVGITTVACRTTAYSNATVSSTQVIGYTNLANTAFAGETYRIRALGYRTGTNNSGALLRIAVDGITALTFNHAGSATANGFGIEAYVTIMTTGATGTAWTQGLTNYGITWQTSNVTATTAISTTSNSLIELTLASGSASNTYFVTNATIEQMN